MTVKKYLVYYNKVCGRYVSNEKVYIGLFNTELEAEQCCNRLFHGRDINATWDEVEAEEM